MTNQVNETLQSVELPSDGPLVKFATPSGVFSIRTHSAHSWSLLRGGTLLAEFIRVDGGYQLMHPDALGEVFDDWRKLVRSQI